MKKLKLFFALFAMLALGVGNAWGAEKTVSWTATTNSLGSAISKVNGTATGTIKTGDFVWNYTRTLTSLNSGKTDYVQMSNGYMQCGSSNAINSLKFQTSNILGTIKSVAVNCASYQGKHNISITVGGTTYLAKTAVPTWSSNNGGVKTGTGTSSGEIIISFTDGTRALYIKSITVVYEETSSGGTEPVLSSIEISGDLTKKTYEEGEELDLAGLTVTAKYDDNSEEDVTKDVEWSYTPNPLIKGTTSVSVTATYEDKTATKTINDLTVNEHIITPGEYELLLNNVFFGTTAGTNISSFPTSAKQDDITVTLNGSGTKTRTDAANVRMYTGNTLTFSVPVGYLITSIAFTEPSSGTQWDGKITVNPGDYDETNKSWSGLAQDVVFTFGAQNRIAKAIVTYIADVKSTLTIETPQNGTISVKDGATEVATGTQVSAGTSLVVTPTPATGYVFESLTVDGIPVDLTEGSYNLTMPAADVTISATFKENEKPEATLTLSKNGVTETFPGSWKQDDKVTLPSITSDCVKEFVGWSANPTCNVEPEYKEGDEYTLASTTQTLYAVYADEKESTTTEEYTFTSFTSAQEVTLGSTSFRVKLQKGTGSTNPAWNSGSAEARIYAKGLLTIVASKPIVKVVYSYTINANNSGKKPTVDGVAGKNSAGTWDADTKTWTGSDTEIILSTSGDAGNVGFKKIVVTLGSIGFENYSTTCSAALANPTFSLAAGKYTEGQSITLSAAEGTIYYTLDGTTPTASSTQYTGAIALNDCGEYTIKAIAISSDSYSDVVSATYTIKLPLTNSQAAPYTEAEAIAVYDGDCYDNQDVYVKGTVKTATFYNSGTYTITLTNGFQFYKFYKDGSKTLFADGEINKGDVLVACGKLSKYNTTYQLAEGCYLVEHEPYTEPKTDISNTEATAYTVDKAFELIADVSSDLTKEVFVKGLVAVAPTSNPTADGQMTYKISDNGENTGNVLTVYLGLNLNGEKFTSKNDVQQGDYVVVKGQLLDYNGTYELNKGNQLVQHVKAATITISDITMEVEETKTIAATIVPAEAEVTYTIKENAANAISLSGNTITALAEGTATITATVAEGAGYLANSVDFKVTVTPKSEKTNVVILAEYKDKWYALVAAKGSANNTLGAVEVNYVNGVILDFDGDKASITWERAVVGNKATFKNGTNYMKGATGSTNLTLETSAFEWEVVDGKYLVESKRTFLYNKAGYFKNYDANTNAGKTDYSAWPVVTAVEFMKSVVTPSVEKGIFSVADGKFVQFSTGNLQYEVETNTWSFASEQYEVIGGEAYTGSNNTNLGMNVPGYTGKLDLFAWSCDGKFGVNPSNADADYTGEFADWGNLVNEEGWYTLTATEMNYLLNRKKDGKKLWALATVCGMNGLILLPDNWNTSTTLEYGYIPADWNYTKNQLDAAAWAALETAGAVFLPEGGSRVGGYGNKIGFDGETEETDVTKLDANDDYFHVDNVGDYGYYWLNTQDTRPAYPHCASYLILPGWNEGATNADNDDICLQPQVWSREKRRGNSVRLVKAVTPDYTREVRQGYYGTICLRNGGQMIGASLFGLSYYNEAQGLLYMDEADATMVAGNPYIFLPNEGATNNTLYVFYDETTATKADTVNGLVGYLGDENMQLPGDGTNYILQDNKIKKVVGGNNSNVFVTKNRAYIQLGSVEPKEQAPVPGRRRVAIGQAPQVATGMESVDASAQPVKMIIDGQLYILRGEKMYDAQGKLVK